MTIGYETNQDIRNIRYERIDVLHLLQNETDYSEELSHLHEYPYKRPHRLLPHYEVIQVI